MDRKSLIIVTLMFMLIVGTILFFTLINLGEKNPNLKMSITGSTTYEESSRSVYEIRNEDYISQNQGCRK